MRFVVTLDEKKDKLAVEVCKAAGRNKKRLLLKLIDSYVNKSNIESIEELKNVNIFEIESKSSDENGNEFLTYMEQLVETNIKIADSLNQMVTQGSTIQLVSQKENEASNPDVVDTKKKAIDSLLGNCDID